MTEKAKKKRVSTLAKSYEVPGDVFIKLLKDAGVEVKSAASMIDSETFLSIKPALLKEKEKIERKEMAKAGKKIPMKVVLKKKAVPKKKAPAAKVKKADPVVPKETSAEKAVTSEETPKVPEAKAESKPEKKASAPDRVEKEPASRAKTEKKEAIPAEPVPEALLKVSVEKPDEKLAARIQKYMDERAVKRAAPKSEKGYSGKFGKAPVQERPKKKEGGFANKLQDVYAVRAQDAGVVGISTGKPDTRKDFSYQKKKQKGKGRKKKTREQIEQELSELKSNVNKVMAQVGRTSRKTVYKKEDKEEEVTEEKKVLNVPEFVSISELAGLMNESPNMVIAKCMELGIMVTINHRLDHETIAIIADEFEYEVQLMDEYAEEVIEDEEETAPETMEPRAPIVTIMGHVDHGKTSILDYIRKSTIASGETGGITQHIGAYSVDTPQGRVCFLDTPGHQAFAAMRSRGAQVTDVIVLVVAADSQVMPQTKEAIEHAKSANVELVVAINKCDLPNANIDKIKGQLAEEGVQVDGWGGNVSCVEVSAKTGENIDKLLETLALESEVLELKANPLKRAKGTVIETRLDKGKGIVATVVIQDGTIKTGDPFIAGSFSGRVRSLLDDKNKKQTEAGPSTPIQILGLEGMPQAGDSLVTMKSEKESREVALRRSEAAKDRDLRQKRHITLDQLHEQIESGEFHELKVIIKGDVDGSVEAIATSLNRLSTPEVKINIISQGVGAVKEADIHLAAASDAIIIAFHLLPSEKVRRLAENEGITINYYRIIYDVVDDIIKAMEGLLDPELREDVVGEAKILELFKIPRVGIIAGSLVNSGYVDRDSHMRLFREGIEIGEGKVSSLKRHQDDAKSVKAGLECGIGIEGLKDIQVNDVLAFFKTVKVAKKLSQQPVT